MKFGLIILALLLSSSLAAAQDKGPVVVELFTSQSCSSCPPADAFLSELVKDKDLLVLGCHVTYWNHLSWRDTLSIEECTDHQKRFNSITGIGRVYTPQIAVNGRYEDVGSKKAEIKRFIKKAKGDGVLPIGLSLDDVTLTVSLPEIGRLKKPLSVQLMAYDDVVTEKIERGENWNKEISYTHPVQHLVKLDDWDGHAKTESIFVTHMPINGGYAVIARENESGAVVAAGSVKQPALSEPGRDPKVSPSRGFQLRSDTP